MYGPHKYVNPQMRRDHDAPRRKCGECGTRLSLFRCDTCGEEIWGNHQCNCLLCMMSTKDVSIETLKATIARLEREAKEDHLGAAK